MPRWQTRIHGSPEVAVPVVHLAFSSRRASWCHFGLGHHTVNLRYSEMMSSYSDLRDGKLSRKILLDSSLSSLASGCVLDVSLIYILTEFGTEANTYHV
jgi:hypothetical protein